MAHQYGILVDLDRCVGCYACEVACKQEHPLLEGTPYIRVNTVGPRTVVGKLEMDFIPVISDDCDFCREGGHKPSCVAHCPAKAMSVCTAGATLESLRGEKRYQVGTVKTI